MSHQLEIDGIQLAFGTRTILSDIYIKCETGKITGILGRNGEGKTCLMNVVHGSLAAGSKSIRFDTISIPRALKRPDLLGYLPQFNFIPSSLTLKRIFSDFNLDYAEFENHFTDFRSKYKSGFTRLSGGEKRLVEVYVIIKAAARFAMLDEPFSHLMPLQIEKVKELLMAEKQHKGFFITDHMYEHVIDICSDLYILTRGKTYRVKQLSDIEELGYVKQFP
ncbi:MAG: ATP-binding cassette domain-containing protein [Flavihumibacter sp.]